MATQIERHKLGNWMTGFRIYEDGGDISQCENEDQVSGYNCAYWAEKCHLGEEARHISEEEVTVL